MVAGGRAADTCRSFALTAPIGKRCRCAGVGFRIIAASKPLEKLVSLSFILLIVVILLLIGALPSWGYSRSWGYGPSGGLGLVLIVVIVLLLMGRI